MPAPTPKGPSGCGFAFLFYIGAGLTERGAADGASRRSCASKPAAADVATTPTAKLYLPRSFTGFRRKIARS